MHQYRCDKPAADRCWTQIVGGGPGLKPGPSYPTVIEGEVLDGKLCLTVYNIRDGVVQEVFEFSPRSS